jgi:hypothetical protein
MIVLFSMKIGNDFFFIFDVCSGNPSKETNDFPSKYLSLIIPDKDDHLPAGPLKLEWLEG